MNVLVTGASGFIGSALVRELIHRKHRVSVFLHKRGIPEENLCRVFWGDIGDPIKIKAALKDVDLVFHLAASMGASQAGEEEFIRINEQGVQVVFKAAQEAGVKKVVHFSSAGVLGAVSERKAVGEEYLKNPISVYDRTKSRGERKALDFSLKGLNVSVVRPGWVYGPGDERTFKLIKAIAGRKFIFVTGSKTLQTPVYINDLVQGTLLCAEKGKRGEIYHIAGNEVMTTKQISRCIADAAGVSLPILPFPLCFIKMIAFVLENGYKIFNKEAPLTMGRLAFFAHSKPLSIEKAELELGYVSQYDFKTGISKAIEWYKKNGWLND